MIKPAEFIHLKDVAARCLAKKVDTKLAKMNITNYAV